MSRGSTRVEEMAEGEGLIQISFEEIFTPTGSHKCDPKCYRILSNPLLGFKFNLTT